MIELNDIAPDFTLKNTNKEDVSLSDYDGRAVVLAFYPAHLPAFVIPKCAPSKTT